MSLKGKTVVITGASRGIGEAAAEEFAQVGAKLVLLARGQTAIETIAARIGESALALSCDVSNYDDVARAIQAAEGAFGPVEVLINNAGVVEPVSHLATSDPAAWGKVIDINLKGCLLYTSPSPRDS